MEIETQQLFNNVQINIKLKDIDAHLYYSHDTVTNVVRYYNSHIAKRTLAFVYDFEFTTLEDLYTMAKSSYESLKRLYENVKGE